MHCSDTVLVRPPNERLPDETNGTLQLPIWSHLGVTLSSRIMPHGNCLLPLLTFLLYEQLPAPQPKSWSMQDRKDRNRKAEPNSPSFFPSSVDILAALTTAVWFPRSSFYLQETTMPLSLSLSLTFSFPSFSHLALLPPAGFLAFYNSLPDMGCWSTPRSANCNNPSYLITTKELQLHAPSRGPAPLLHTLSFPARNVCTHMHFSFQMKPVSPGTNTTPRHAKTPSSGACPRGKKEGWYGHTLALVCKDRGRRNTQHSPAGVLRWVAAMSNSWGQAKIHPSACVWCWVMPTDDCFLAEG